MTTLAPPPALPDWNAAALAAIAAYCGWNPAPSRRETLNISPVHKSRDLWLPTRRVREIHSVSIVDAEGRERRLSEHEYQWEESGLLRCARHRHWPMRLRGVAVDLTHGFEWEEVPDISALVHNITRRASAGVYGIASQSVSGASVTYQTAGGAPLSVPLLQIEKQMLGRYTLASGTIPG